MKIYRIRSPFAYRSTPTPKGEEIKLGALEPVDEPRGVIVDVNRMLLGGEIDKCDVVITKEKEVVDPLPGKIYLRKAGNHLVYTAMTSQGKIIRNRTLKNVAVPSPFTEESIESLKVKEKILDEMSKAGYTPKIPTLFDVRAEDVGLSPHQKKLYKTPEYAIDTKDQSKMASMMMPMLDSMDV